MKDFYIVKKSNHEDLLRPNPVVTTEEFKETIAANNKFTWYENTELGIKREKYNPVKKQVSAYLNFDSKNEKNYIYVTIPIFGYVKVRFDYNIKKENLIDLMDFADSMDCYLWQYKPKQMIVDLEFVTNYGKKESKNENF